MHGQIRHPMHHRSDLLNTSLPGNAAHWLTGPPWPPSIQNDAQMTAAAAPNPVGRSVVLGKCIKVACLFDVYTPEGGGGVKRQLQYKKLVREVA